MAKKQSGGLSSLFTHFSVRCSQETVRWALLSLHTLLCQVLSGKQSSGLSPPFTHFSVRCRQETVRWALLSLHTLLCQVLSGNSQVGSPLTSHTSQSGVGRKQSSGLSSLFTHFSVRCSQETVKWALLSLHTFVCQVYQETVRWALLSLHAFVCQV